MFLIIYPYTVIKTKQGNDAHSNIETATFRTSKLMNYFNTHSGIGIMTRGKIVQIHHISQFSAKFNFEGFPNEGKIVQHHQFLSLEGACRFHCLREKSSKITKIQPLTQVTV